MFHPYIAELLAGERRRDYLEAARTSHIPDDLRHSTRRKRRLGVGGYRLRFGLLRPPTAQLGADCSP